MLTGCLVNLHFVKIVGEVRKCLLESLPLLDVLADLPRLGRTVHGVSRHCLPMVKHTLREGLASGVGAEIGGETEGLVDGQVCLDMEHGGSHDLSLFKNVTSPSVQNSVDTSNGVLGTLKIRKKKIRDHFTRTQNKVMLVRERTPFKMLISRQCQPHGFMGNAQMREPAKVITCKGTSISKTFNI